MLVQIFIVGIMLIAMIEYIILMYATVKGAAVAASCGSCNACRCCCTTATSCIWCWQRRRRLIRWRFAIPFQCGKRSGWDLLLMLVLVLVGLASCWRRRGYNRGCGIGIDGHNAILAILAKAKHVPDAAQYARLLGPRLAAMLAIVERALEGSVALRGKSALVIAFLEQPGLARL